jgi:WD40 repeat protein/energy-coupling factor transporter ATP-binding protein EcfA2
MDREPARASSMLGELREDLDDALQQLRVLAQGIYPPALEGGGLAVALEAAVDRAAIPATLQCAVTGRYRPEVEAAVYFCCLEALQNAAKYAGGGARATVRVGEADGLLRFEVVDTGAGFDQDAIGMGSGMRNMLDRIDAVAGTLEISSSPGHGTSVAGSAPLKGVESVAPAGSADCPYRGLLAFGAEDHRYYFGREQVVEEVLKRIAPGRPLAVIGASGSGKSSLLGAGVLAAVNAGELSCVRSTRWITPGSEPPLELTGDERELLVVDQFEELYTQCRDSDRRAAFIDALLAYPGPVVIGVRADFYGEMSTHRELIAAVSSNQVPLGPMSEPELRSAIEAPARLAGLQLEPGLVDLVLRDVAGEPGALPLMSHALRETWERRDGRTLTLQAYADTGGVGSALARTADEVVAHTPHADRPLLRGIFLRLTEFGEDAEETRRRVMIEELLPQGAEPEAVRALLEQLVQARLVILGDGGTAEVAHEVLIRRWPTLRQWLQEDRDGIRLHRRLSDAARLWNGAGRDPTDLYRGTRLDAAVEWAKGNGELLNHTERAFLDQSLDESAAAQRRQVKINRRLQRALTAAACLLLAAIALLLYALISRHDAVRSETSAKSQALAAKAVGQLDRDPQRALLLARAALRLATTPEAMLATSEALDANTARSQLPPFGVQGCANSNWLYLLDRGRIAVDNTCDGYVVFGDLSRRRIIRHIRVGPNSTYMHFDPTGRTLIVATGRSLVSVDPVTYRVHRTFTAPFKIERMATEFPGKALAVGDADTVGLIGPRGRLRVIAHGDQNANPIIDMLWTSSHELLVETGGQSRGTGDLAPGLTLLDVARGTRRTVALPMRPAHFAVLGFMNISADARTWFITGADASATSGTEVASTWAIDARSRRVRWVARGPVGQGADSVNGSPDSRFVAVAYSQGAVDVLDAYTGRRVVRDLGSASLEAGWMAFPPGDKSLVTISLDGVYRTWSNSGSERLRVQAPVDSVLAFTPDGHDLALVGARGKLVDVRSGATVGEFPGFPAASAFNACYVTCFAFSPGLQWLTYVDSAFPTPRIVELKGRTGRQVAAVKVPRLDSQSVAPDGRIVAAYVDGDRLKAQLINPRSGVARDLQPAPSSDSCAATTPSFTPDGRLMAIDDGCVSLSVWDVRSGRVVRTAILPDRANASNASSGGALTATAAVLSPDGHYALVAVEGGGLIRLDVATGTFAELSGTHTVAKALAVSPNGRFYAIGRQDGTVDEYDARTLQLVRHHVLDHAVQALAFSPDSAQLAVEDAGNVVGVWDTCDVCENRAALSALAAHESVRPLTPSERATFGVSWP